MKFIFPSIFLIIGLTLTSCKNNDRPFEKLHLNKTLFTNLQSEKTNIAFQNEVKNTPDFNIFSYRNFYNGGGVAIGDVNNDGLQDIYFTSNMGENKLYINEGDFKFKDISELAGITDVDKWSTGVSMVDINADGFLDIYVCNAGFRKGSNTKNSLFINNGDLTFTESAALLGLDDEGYTTHTAFFDYDLDGDLDAYILNNSFIPVNTLNFSNKREVRAKDWPVKDFLKGGGDKLLRNENGKFVDVSQNAGIYGSLIGFGLGVTIGDINNDLWPDIYVSNDFFEKDYLYVNNGDGTFSEELENRIDHISTSSMGADMADLNNDGYPEIFVTDMLPFDENRLKTTTSFDNINVQNVKLKNGFYNQNLQNSLQINDETGNFVETSFYSGVAASDWSWGALLFDANMDMLTDIYVCNGIYHDVIDQDFIDFFANDVIQKMALTGHKNQLDSIINKMPSKPIQNVAFQNTGNLQFKNMSTEWGFIESTFSNGAAYGDLDNDGDLDLVINNVNQPASIYKNNARELYKSNFLGLTLKSYKPNLDAIGSKIEIYSGNIKQTKQLIPNRGFQSSMDMRVNFGLGNNNKVDSVVITWPNRDKMIINNLEINKYHTVNQGENKNNLLKTQSQYSLFSTVQNDLADHKEDIDFIDFYYERNIPYMLSQEGPRIAIGDINNDGFQDIYFCGAKGSVGKIYFGTMKGFKESNQKIFTSFIEWEDTESVFFDADGDGDLDLFVGSGGNNGPVMSRELQDRMFFNDGKGNFDIDVLALPPNGYNTSRATVYDFDSDGDLDLFVASRSFPGEYGMDPKHFLYENNGKGKFRNILDLPKSKIESLGMLTDAKWIDIDNKGGLELVVVGEWMSPKIYSYSNSSLVEVKSNLSEYKGLWQSIEPVDIDNDGDQDLILGNVGTNGYLNDERYLPLKLFINDFDNNGMPEKIITRTVNSNDFPIVMKREMVDQLAILKKKNLKHQDYANKSIQNLLGKSLESAAEKSISYLKSAVAINQGNGQFKLVELPFQAQFSSIKDILVEDINADNYFDLIIVGNSKGFQPQYGQLDGFKGLVLLNNQQNGFIPQPQVKTGLFVRGCAKQIEHLKDKSKDQYIVVRNNEKPYTFTKTNNLQ